MKVYESGQSSKQHKNYNKNTKQNSYKIDQSVYLCTKAMKRQLVPLRNLQNCGEVLTEEYNLCQNVM